MGNNLTELSEYFINMTQPMNVKDVIKAVYSLMFLMVLFDLFLPLIIKVSALLPERLPKTRKAAN